MDISTLVGIGGAFAAVIFTLIIEGGNPISFINFGALILIGGGSFAVAITSFSLKEAVAIPSYLKQAFFPPSFNVSELITLFVSIGEKARREGLLSLEDDISQYDEEMMRTGMELVVDGVDPEIIRNLLDDLSTSEMEHNKVAAEVFETMGGFSPTLGIIGTVMGLVHVLESLGGAGGISELGSGIAVAFIATFYGIGFANLLWLPLANKIKYINHHVKVKNEIILIGILGVQNGDNPRVLRERLLALVADHGLKKEIREKAEAGATEGGG
jgi:chemotaxis protein MotA